MPKYKCHKNVWALKIKAIEFDCDKAKAEQRETDGSATITPDDERYVLCWVDEAEPVTEEAWQTLIPTQVVFTCRSIR